ncbi:tyrosine-type recombinase/integrase [Devosia salina]|uniref:Tyrosine-type recombinase/integrase n=1 Tax=Devosia salina TaxID=2860336 RepID=A0ABX8WK74_9HYPH|nr:tyrosine-type recombinase/integrase [Devosia salina]QYO76685.1 tyrosine-type recombinase/integrase [Devosia salina]
MTLVVEDAFAVLRDAGLSPGARSALSAVLDSVMNDLDRTGQQWSQRLRYKALLESLDTRPSDDALKAEASSDELIGQLAIPTNLPVPQPSPAAPLADQSSTDLAQTVMSAIRLASLHPDANKPLTSFLPDYLAGLRRKGRGEQYLSEIGTKVRIFVCTIGDKPVHEYGKTDLLHYRDLIDQMPFDAIKHLKTDDPVKAIALNKERAQPLPPISPTTVNSKYLTVIRGLFGHLVHKGILATNPVTGVNSEQVVDGEDLLDVEIRLPFTADMEAAIFREASKKPKYSADYWWPRVNCRQGLRLQEFTQLCVSDFRMLHGRMCIDLLHFDFDGDPFHAIRKTELRLKSSAARRIFPLAREVIDDGILDLIERRRRQDGPNARLFPKEKPDRFGNTSSALSKRANRVVRSVTSDARYVAYSARHLFAQRCDEAGIPIAIRNMFMGHEPEDTEETKQRKRLRGRHVSARYGSPLPTAEDFAWFDKIKFSTS